MYFLLFPLLPVAAALSIPALALYAVYHACAAGLQVLYSGGQVSVGIQHMKDFVNMVSRLCTVFSQAGQRASLELLCRPPTV